MSDIDTIFETDEDGLREPAEPRRAGAVDDVLVIPLSSFDFLEGRFRAASRTRFMNTMTVLVIVSVIALGLLQTFNARLAQSESSTKLNAVNAELSQARTELGEEQKAGGATPDEVDTHVKSRAQDAVAALAKQIAYRTVIEAIIGVGNGIEVSNITFTPSAGEAGFGVVVVTGRSSTLKIGLEVTGVLADTTRYPYFAIPQDPKYNSAVSCTTPDADNSSSTGGTSDGSTLGCTWTWAGTLTGQALSPRMKELAKQYDVEAIDPTEATVPSTTQEGDS